MKEYKTTEERRAYQKSYEDAHKEQKKAYMDAHREHYRELGKQYDRKKRKALKEGKLEQDKNGIYIFRKNIGRRTVEEINSVETEIRHQLRAHSIYGGSYILICDQAYVEFYTAKEEYVDVFREILSIQG